MKGLTCMISKFADDTKIISKVTTTAHKLQFQLILDILVNWSEKWQLKFNVNKCKVLHISNNNQYTKYTMNSLKLSKVSHEKDLVTNLKPDKHCSDVKKANKLVGFIRRTLEYKSEKVILILFNTPIDQAWFCCSRGWVQWWRECWYLFVFR